MKIKVEIPSSTYNSNTIITIKNVDENDLEVLLTILTSTKEENIYVLKKDLQEAISKF